MKKSKKVLALLLAFVMFVSSCCITLVASAFAVEVEVPTATEVAEKIRNAKLAIYQNGTAVPGSLVYPGAGNSGTTVVFNDQCTDNDKGSTHKMIETFGSSIIYLGTDQTAVSVYHKLESDRDHKYTYDGGTGWWRQRDTLGSMAGEHALGNTKYTGQNYKITDYATLDSNTNDLPVWDHENMSFSNATALAKKTNNGNGQFEETVNFNLKDGASTTDGTEVYLPFYYYIDNALTRNGNTSYAAFADGTVSGKMSTPFSGTNPKVTIVVYDKQPLKDALSVYSESVLQTFISEVENQIAMDNLDAKQDLANYKQAVLVAEHLCDTKIKELTQSQIIAAQEALNAAALRIMSYEVSEDAYEAMALFTANSVVSSTKNDSTGLYDLSKPITVTIQNSSNKKMILSNYQFSDNQLVADKNIAGQTVEIEPYEYIQIKYTGSVKNANLYKITANFDFTFEGFASQFKSKTLTILITEALPALPTNFSMSSNIRHFNPSPVAEHVKTYFYPAEGYLQVGEDVANINTRIHCYGFYATGTNRSIEWYFHESPFIEAGFKTPKFSIAAGTPCHLKYDVNRDGSDVREYDAIISGNYEGPSSGKAYIPLNNSQPAGNFNIDVSAAAPTVPSTLVVNWGDPNKEGGKKWDVTFRQSGKDQKLASNGTLVNGKTGEKLYGTDEPGDGNIYVPGGSYNPPKQIFHVFDTTPFIAALAKVNDVIGQESLYAMSNDSAKKTMDELKLMSEKLSVVLTTRYIQIDNSTEAKVYIAIEDIGGEKLIQAIKAYQNEDPNTDSTQDIIVYLSNMMLDKAKEMETYRKISLVSYHTVMEKLAGVKEAINFDEYADASILPPAVDKDVWAYYADGVTETGTAVSTALEKLYAFAYKNDGTDNLASYYGTDSQALLEKLCVALSTALDATLMLKGADYTSFYSALKKAEFVSADPYPNNSFSEFLTAYQEALLLDTKLIISKQGVVDAETTKLLSAITKLVLDNNRDKENLETVEYFVTYAKTAAVINSKETRTGKFGDVVRLQTFNKYLVAAQKMQYPFIGWYDGETGEFITSGDGTVALNSNVADVRLDTKNKHYEARFNPIGIPVAAGSTQYKIEFYDSGESLVGMLYVPADKTDANGKYGSLDSSYLPEIPKRLFFDEGKWMGGGDLNHITKDIKLYATYNIKSPDSYTININGQTITDQAKFDDVIWNKAVSTSDNFYCWVNGTIPNGYDKDREMTTYEHYDIVSYDSTYNFRVGGHSNLIEVTADNLDAFGLDGTKVPVITMRHAEDALDYQQAVIVDNDGDTKRLRFLARYTVPEGYTVNEVGMLFVKGRVQNVNFRTPGVIVSPTNKDTNVALGNIFMMNINFGASVSAATGYTARAYITYSYTNETGRVVTETILSANDNYATMPISLT